MPATKGHTQNHFMSYEPVTTTAFTRNFISTEHIIKLLQPCNVMYSYLHMTRALLYLSSIGDSRENYFRVVIRYKPLLQRYASVYSIIINNEVPPRKSQRKCRYKFELYVP